MTEWLRPDDAVELWAGAECTVNRVGDRYIDQIAASGHADRDADLDLLVWLGVKAVRYPVLWERTAPANLESADWAWADRRLGRLRSLGIRPIVGLLHHGSGPRHTSLLDPSFPEALAGYARAVAERFPWVQDWTPINEPLTTARFSALYGHWFPHARSTPAFVSALINQCRGIALAMRAIRRVVPRARLIQPEDLGRTYATPACSVQAQYENHRRLLGMDLLCGRVTAGHPLRDHLADMGATHADLDSLAEAPCPPDVMGINYYVSSDRFLDDRTERFPSFLHGGNGHQRYVDVEAVRVADSGATGHGPLLRELWDRYQRPLAITEVHLGCTRDEQLRWFAEAWRGATAARRAGIDVRAVTAWSLLGTFGWDHLVTDPDGGAYEPGLFDVRGPRPRATALARVVRTLAHRRPFAHPALATEGWWRRAARVLYPASAAHEEAVLRGRPLLITGANGTLARAFERVARQRGLATRALSRGQMDIVDARAVARQVEALRPWAIINAAGYVRVDAAEREAAACWRENVDGPVALSRACREAGIPLVTFSSDLVFDGRADTPYLETTPTSPLGVYGASKAAAEMRVASTPRVLVIRAAAFFGPWDQHNFVTVALRALAEGRRFAAAGDLLVSPTYVPELVDATLDLLMDDACGIWHLCNQGAVSWAELARRAARAVGLDAALVQEVPWRDLKEMVAPRPAYSVLDSGRGQLMGPLAHALAHYASIWQREISLQGQRAA